MAAVARPGAAVRSKPPCRSQRARSSSFRGTVLLLARLVVVERGAVLQRRCGGGATADRHLRCRLHLENVNDRSRGRGNGADVLQHAEGDEPLEQTRANHLCGAGHMR
eukprot:scaffold13055_cov56-Phaeocystis_antarctica.AAC.1